LKICLFSKYFPIFIIHHVCLTKIGEICLQKYPPISGKLFKTIVLKNYLKQNNSFKYQTILNFQPPLPLNGNLRNTSYMKKIPNFEL